jgi:hypothetical protein
MSDFFIGLGVICLASTMLGVIAYWLLYLYEKRKDRP